MSLSITIPREGLLGLMLENRCAISFKMESTFLLALHVLCRDGIEAAEGDQSSPHSSTAVYWPVHICRRALLRLTLLLLLLLLNTRVAIHKASQCLTFSSGRGAHLPLDNRVFVLCPVVMRPVEKYSVKTHYNAWYDLPSCYSSPINSLSKADLLEY